MELLKGIIESSTRLKVVSSHNMDLKENAAMSTNDGVLVENYLLAPASKRGIRHVHYVNPQTKEQWYEEFDRPLNDREIAEIQGEKIDLLLQMQMAAQNII